MRFLVFTFITGAFAVGTADADNCRAVQQRVVVRHQVQHHAVAAVVTPVVVAQYVPVAVAVPQYSVGYAPYGPQAQQVQQPDPVLSALEKLTLAVERLGGQPQQLQQQPMPPASQEARAPSPAHLQVFAARCASCHDASVAQTKGHGLVLLDRGQLVPIPPKQLLRMVAMTHDGRMPKTGPKLNPAEKQAVSQYVESLLQ